MSRIGAIMLLSALVGAAVVASGCATASSRNKKYTEQNLANATGLRAGMTKSEVLGTMNAAPVKKEIMSASQEEWHYCRTGSPVDQFVAIMFLDERLRGVKNYTVTPNDTGGMYGDCSLFVKYGTYSGPRAPAPTNQYAAPQEPAHDPFSGNYTIKTYKSGFGNSTTTVETWSGGGKRVTKCIPGGMGFPERCDVKSYP